MGVFESSHQHSIYSISFFYSEMTQGLLGPCSQHDVGFTQMDLLPLGPLYGGVL